MKTELDRWHKLKQMVVLMVSEAERLTKVSDTLDDFEIEAVMTKATNLQPGRFKSCKVACKMDLSFRMVN